MKQIKKYKKSFKPKESEIRKEFYKRLLYIFLGIIPIILVWEQKGLEKFIGLVGFLFSMYQLIMTIVMSQQIVDDFFPPKTAFEFRTEPMDKFIYYFAMTIFFSGAFLINFEIGVIERTINGTSFFWYSALIGVAIATLITIILKLIKPSVYYESDRRSSVHWGLFFGFFLLLPTIASFINHNYAEINENCARYEIVSVRTETPDFS